MSLNYRKFLPKILAFSLIALGVNAPSVNGKGTSEILRQGEAYYCDETTYEHPNLVFRSDLGNIRLIEFQTEAFAHKKRPPFNMLKKNWTPLERCRELASRGMRFEREGIISHLTEETMPNGIKAICISKVHADHLQLIRDGEGGSVRLFLTLKADDNPQEVLKRIKGISAIASGEDSPLIH